MNTAISSKPESDATVAYGSNDSAVASPTTSETWSTSRGPVSAIPPYEENIPQPAAEVKEEPRGLKSVTIDLTQKAKLTEKELITEKTLIPKDADIENEMGDGIFTVVDAEGKKHKIYGSVDPIEKKIFFMPRGEKNVILTYNIEEGKFKSEPKLFTMGYDKDFFDRLKSAFDENVSQFYIKGGLKGDEGAKLTSGTMEFKHNGKTHTLTIKPFDFGNNNRMKWLYGNTLKLFDEDNKVAYYSTKQDEMQFNLGLKKKKSYFAALEKQFRKHLAEFVGKEEPASGPEEPHPTERMKPEDHFIVGVVNAETEKKKAEEEKAPAAEPEQAEPRTDNQRNRIAELCGVRNIPCFVIPEANHSLETNSPLKDIEVLRSVMKETEKFITASRID